jgi:hypothetical protein
LKEKNKRQENKDKINPEGNKTPKKSIYRRLYQNTDKKQGEHEKKQTKKNKTKRKAKPQRNITTRRKTNGRKKTN